MQTKSKRVATAEFLDAIEDYANGRFKELVLKDAAACTTWCKIPRFYFGEMFANNCRKLGIDPLSVRGEAMPMLVNAAVDALIDAGYSDVKVIPNPNDPFAFALRYYETFQYYA
jgi:hypothetical protein